MTRTEIRKRVQMMLGEWAGTPGGRNPLQLDTWISTACDELCRGTDAYYAQSAIDIAAGQVEYAAPDTYKVMAVTAQDAGGQIRPLSAMTPRQMDRISSVWREHPGGGPPAFYVIEGTMRFKLYPVPNYTLAAGLTVEGYTMPGDSWDEDTDDCPLPVVAHMGVVFGACRLRITELPTEENLARLPLIEQMYQEMRGKLEREVGTRSDATARGFGLAA